MRRGIAASVLVLVLVVLGAWGSEYTAPGLAKDCEVHSRRAPAAVPVAGARAVQALGLRQRGGTVNDASCLNRTPVLGVLQPRSAGDVQRAVKAAAKDGTTISVAGTKHALGGQALYPGALLLDMRRMDSITYDSPRHTVRVGAGATWADVIEALHARGRAVKAMPSVDILSIGGTVSANAHGVDFRVGSLDSTVREIRIVDATGKIRQLSRDQDPDLFRAVIGGYGLFGVILDVEFDTVPDETYRLDKVRVPTAEVANRFAVGMRHHQTALMYVHLSTSPGSFLEEAIVYTYDRTGTDEPAAPLVRQQDSRMARLVFNLARHGGVGQRVRWSLQKHVLPRVRQCEVSRNAALRAAEACMVSRSQAMYNDLGFLNNRLPQYTDVLQEYFLEPDQLAPFLASARSTFASHDAQLLSASVRMVHAGEAMLRYAHEDRLSVVLYLSQGTDAKGVADMKSLTEGLVALALDHGGTFYLPYQQYYSGDQVRAAYPMLDDFFALKRRVDPDLRFMNSIYARFS